MKLLITTFFTLLLIGFAGGSYGQTVETINYLLNGSYFENDEDFQIEMELCSAASQMARLTMQELVEENSQP